MNAQPFLRELPGLFDDFPASDAPKNPRFADVLEHVPGLARPNNLALVNLAASLLDPGECYLEAGTYRGTSLVAAMLGNEDKEFVAIDDFSLGDGSRAQLEANLGRFGLAGAEILEGDVQEVLRGDALAGRQVGVYYYDDGHSYEQHLDGLRLVEPYLADGALLIVDDSDWEQVQRALADYLAGQPRARTILELQGDDHGAPQWWKGVTALEWSGAAG